MNMPQCFLAYAPRGAGLLVAMTYVVDDVNVAGWWIGHKDHAYQSAYFLLENYYSTHPTEFFAAVGSDVYGGWRQNFARVPPGLDGAVRADDALCHRLQKIQDAFVSEWLFFASDKRAEADLLRYRESEIAIQDVNVRFDLLTKFNREAPVWRYYSYSFEGAILAYMQTRWPLDYRDQ